MELWVHMNQDNTTHFTTGTEATYHLLVHA